MGIAFFGTNIFAEPHKNADKYSSFQPEKLQPLEPTTKIEELRAYHNRLDLINAIHHPDIDDEIWKPHFIDSHIVRKDNIDGSK